MSEWRLNEGGVPPGVKEGTKLTVVHRDGTRCTAADFDHKDLWVDEPKGSPTRGAKDIVSWRKEK